MSTTTILLDHGADTNTINHDGETPLHHAVRHFSGHCVEMVTMLLDRGAYKSITDSKGNTALLYAATERGDSQSRSVLANHTAKHDGLNAYKMSKEGPRSYSELLRCHLSFPWKDDLEKDYTRAAMSCSF